MVVSFGDENLFFRNLSPTFGLYNIKLHVSCEFFVIYVNEVWKLYVICMWHILGHGWGLKDTVERKVSCGEY